MESTDICSTLHDILSKIPSYSPTAISQLEQQQERYSELLARNVDTNIAMKKYVPLCYDIGLNIKRGKGEAPGKKQQFWLEKAIDDFRSEVKALRTDMNCAASAPAAAPVSIHIKMDE